MIPFYQSLPKIIIKHCFSRSCSPSRVTKQTYFGNFIFPQTHFGCPKPSGKCYVTPLILIEVLASKKKLIICFFILLEWLLTNLFVLVLIQDPYSISDRALHDKSQQLEAITTVTKSCILSVAEFLDSFI